MGCDIHMFAEVNKNGKWEKISKKFKNPHYDFKRETKIDEDGYEWNSEFQDEPYDGRNYDLFGILADVRNGRGFAGIKTGEGFIPISEPRGLPLDVSKEIKEQSDEWDCDGHSHSYFTLSELKAYDWNQVTLNFGCVPIKRYEACKGKIPESYCGGVSGDKILLLYEKEADFYLKHGNPLFEGKEIYVQMKWEESYKEASGNFLDNITEKLSPFGGNDDVRVVLWFDN